MISFDGNSLPFEMLAVAFVCMAIVYGLSGIFAEMTWRKRSLRDLELGKQLRDIGTSDALATAKDCERVATKRIDAHLNKTNVLSLIFGALVRGVPYFSLMMVCWLFYQIWVACTSGFEWRECFVSLVYWLIAALAAEGLASVMKQYVKPLSERWNKDSAVGSDDAQKKIDNSKNE